jgi:hypothetical protein
MKDDGADTDGDRNPNSQIRMTKEYPMTNPECPDTGNDYVIRAWSFFRHYGLVIRRLMKRRPHPAGTNQKPTTGVSDQRHIPSSFYFSASATA